MKSFQAQHRGLSMTTTITIIASLREGSGMITVALNEWIHPWHHPHRTEATRQSEASNEHRPKQEALWVGGCLVLYRKRIFISKIYIGWVSREQSVISVCGLGASSVGQYTSTSDVGCGKKKKKRYINVLNSLLHRSLFFPFISSNPLNLLQAFQIFSRLFSQATTTFTMSPCACNCCSGNCNSCSCSSCKVCLLVDSLFK